MAERPKLGQLLIGAEVIVEGQLAAALDEQTRTGRPLGMTLVSMGFLDEETLVRTLARQLSLPIAWIRGKKVRKNVLELVPASIVGAHRCLPVRVDDQGENKTLLLAMEDPANTAVLDEVALAAGMPVKPVLAAPSEIEESIARHFPELDLELLVPEPAQTASLDQELIPGLETGEGDLEEEKDDACMSSLDLGDSSGALAADLSPPEDDELLDPDAAAGGSFELGSPDDSLDLGASDGALDLDDGALEGSDDESPDLLCMRDAASSAPSPAVAELDSVGADVILRALSQLLVEKGVIGREELIERLAQLSGQSDVADPREELDAGI